MRNRLVAAFEVLLFALVLFGHDVFRWRAVPVGEVIPFFFVGWFSLWRRGLGWKDLGLRRPSSWPKTIAIAMVVGLALQAISTYVTEPVMLHVFHQQEDLSDFRQLVGNWKLALLALLVIWTLAAFGEEMVFRGYVFGRIADLTGTKVAAVLLTTILFGFGHYYQGWAGVVDSCISGLTLALLYARTGNLWLPILAHGLTDTFGLLLVVSNQVPSLR
jgi:membrane protease YdiL (CAAX protease family)